ncbi:hypothetical protein ABLO18_16105 [Mycobacterium tuberculosis]
MFGNRDADVQAEQALEVASYKMPLLSLPVMKAPVLTVAGGDAGVGVAGVELSRWWYPG